MKLKILAAIILGIIILTNLASALAVNSVTSNPDEVQPGEKVSIGFTVKNNLNDDIEDVTISLNLNGNVQENIPAVPFAPHQSSSIINFNEILEGKSKNIGFMLIANSNAESGTYKIPVEISYTVPGETTPRVEESLISLIINALPKLDVSTGSYLVKGMNNDLTIKVTNSGLGDAKLLSLKLGPVTGTKILGSDNSYFGDIASDDFDSVDFKVFASENSPAVVNLPVELNYQDSRNNPVTENKNLVIKVYTNAEAVQLGLIKKSNLPLIIGTIVPVIILFLIYRAVRKRLKKKKLSQE